MRNQARIALQRAARLILEPIKTARGRSLSPLIGGVINFSDPPQRAEINRNDHRYQKRNDCDQVNWCSLGCDGISKPPAPISHFSLRLQPQFYKPADDTNLVRAPKIVRHEIHREIVAIWQNRRRPTGLRITNSAQTNRESNLVDQIGSSGQSSPRRPRSNAIRRC